MYKYHCIDENGTKVEDLLTTQILANPQLVRIAIATIINGLLFKSLYPSCAHKGVHNNKTVRQTKMTNFVYQIFSTIPKLCMKSTRFIKAKDNAKTMRGMSQKKMRNISQMHNQH